MNALPTGTSPLDEAGAQAAFGAMLDGACADEEIARFLIALADRGESAAEIAGAARAMRARMIPVAAPAGAIDVCGTGGDGHNTLNVSTAVALVVAACEVPVAKHGNRAASSRAGAADTLAALGLDLDRAARTAERTLAQIGLCFLFAQKHHPALARLMPIRRAIGRRTIFNLLGPLANPAGVSRQLIGLARPELVGTYAQAVRRLGTQRCFVVSGDEGLDELSLAGGNVVADVRPDGVRIARVEAQEAGLERAPVEALRGGDAHHNAAAIRRLLDGERGAYRDAVVFNAAAALMVAGKARSLAEGAEDAAEAIDKGLAKSMLACWIAATS